MKHYLIDISNVSPITYIPIKSVVEKYIKQRPQWHSFQWVQNRIIEDYKDILVIQKIKINGYAVKKNWNS